MRLINNSDNLENKYDFKFGMKSKTIHKNILSKASYSSIDEVLVLETDKKGWCDASRKYCINKDGSAIMQTPFGYKKYEKGTFSDVYQYGKQIFLNNNFKIPYEESLKILEDIEKIKQSLLNNSQ